MNKAIVFYSWQSDLPNKTNRSLIQDALEGAVEGLAAGRSLSVEPVVDRDTRGVPGSPDIGHTIFEKISSSAAFVCDVSLVNSGAEGYRPTPNPNVLIELGYALHALGWGRIVLVFNGATGRIEDLPFDLRQKRALTYNSAESDTERAPARNELRAKLADALGLILEHAEVGPKAKSPAEVALEALATNDPGAAAAVHDFMDWLSARIAQLNPMPPQERPYEDLVFEAILETVEVAEAFARIADGIARRGNREAAIRLLHGLQGVLQQADNFKRTGGVHLRASFDLAKFLCYEFLTTFVAILLRHDRIELIGEVLSEPLTVDTDNGHAAMPFSILSVDVGALRVFFQKKGENWVSPQAEILKSRHADETPLGKLCSWRLMMEADFLLYLRSVFDSKGDPYSTWRPWCYPYLRQVGTPAWLARAESRRRLSELCRAFGGISLEEFLRLYAEYSRKAGEHLPDHADFPPTLPSPQALGSQP